MQSMVQMQQQQQYTYVNSSPMIYNSPPMGMNSESMGAAGSDGLMPPMHPDDDYNGQLCSTNILTHLTQQCKTNDTQCKREVVSLKHLRTSTDKSTWTPVSSSNKEVSHSDIDHEDSGTISKTLDSLSALSTSDSGCVSDVSSGVGDDQCRADNSDSLSPQSTSRSPSSGAIEVVALNRDDSVDSSTDDVEAQIEVHPVKNNITFNPTPYISEVRPFKINPVRHYQQQFINIPHRGSTRVVRPIKEIPPRFMKILTPKHKTYRPRQFEGQPLLQNVHQTKYRTESEFVVGGGYTFNPNAESFVPGQLYDEQASYDQSSSSAESFCSSGVGGGVCGDGYDTCLDVVSPDNSTYTIVMHANSSVYPTDQNGTVCFNSIPHSSSTGYYSSPGGAASGSAGPVYYPSPSYGSPTYMPCGPPSGNSQHQNTQVVYNSMPPVQAYTNVITPTNMPALNSQYTQ